MRQPLFTLVHSPHAPGRERLPQSEVPVVLGLNVTRGGFYSHNASAALVRGGDILALCEQERLDRVKDSGRFPAEAAQACLDQAGIAMGEVAAVAVATDPYFVARRLGREPELDVVEEVYRKLLYRFGQTPPLLVLVNHHLAHAASAFYPSGFADALVVSWDGGGDNQSTVAYRADKDGIRQIREYGFSLGTLYNKFRRQLNLSEKGSLMGLASYGRRGGEMLEGFFDPEKLTIAPALQFAQGGEFMVDETLLSRVGPPRLPGVPLEQRHADLAAQVQYVVETMCRAVVGDALALSPSSRLCLAGGVALNATQNGRLWREGLFQDIFFQPNATDGGLSLGAALEAVRRLTGEVPPCPPMEHAFFGPSFGETEIEQTLALCRVPAVRLSDEALFAQVASWLDQGLVVGWFQGRSEWGPRALGNRSILADPRSKDMADKVNNIIKYREEWRPFALSVLAERAGEYLESPYPDPFMITTAPVREERKSDLAAVVHSDGTTRPQFVRAGTNPRYAALIKAFAAISGVPGVLNTSFNLKGEPIVCTPRDALRTFFSSGLEALVLGNHVVKKAV